MRYFAQRYAMPDRRVAGFLNDVATKELAHLKMIGTIIRQLTRGLSAEELKQQGLDDYYVDHTGGVWMQAASGAPFTAACFQSKGDPVTDLHEAMAAEQKARTTYDNILRLADDPDVIAPIRFLRQREVVHYQRFGEGLRLVEEARIALYSNHYQHGIEPTDDDLRNLAALPEGATLYIVRGRRCVRWRGSK